MASHPELAPSESESDSSDLLWILWTGSFAERKHAAMVQHFKVLQSASFCGRNDITSRYQNHFDHIEIKTEMDTLKSVVSLSRSCLRIHKLRILNKNFEEFIMWTSQNGLQAWCETIQRKLPLF